MCENSEGYAVLMRSSEPAEASPDGVPAELSDDWERLYRMALLIDDVQRRGDTDLDSALLDINEATAASVPGAQFAGLTLVDDQGAISTVAATDAFAVLLDDIQREHREGPCLSAAWTQDILHVDDLETESRWPLYQRSALERTPVRSILSVRLHNDGTSLAALNLYARSSGVFDDESVEHALVFAAHTTVAWNVMRRQQQFRSALASRDIIGQAKGVLMERFAIDAVAAFDLLRRLSQESNTRLADIAERLLASGVGTSAVTVRPTRNLTEE